MQTQTPTPAPANTPGNTPGNTPAITPEAVASALLVLGGVAKELLAKPAPVAADMTQPAMPEATAETAATLAANESITRYADTLDLPLACSVGRVREPDSPVDWNGLRLAGPRAQAAVSAYSGPVVCRVDDGGAHWLDRLRCLGNGITPPVLQWALGRIIAAENCA